MGFVSPRNPERGVVVSISISSSSSSSSSSSREEKVSVFKSVRESEGGGARG